MTKHETVLRSLNNDLHDQDCFHRLVDREPDTITEELNIRKIKRLLKDSPDVCCVKYEFHFDGKPRRVYPIFALVAINAPFGLIEQVYRNNPLPIFAERDNVGRNLIHYACEYNSDEPLELLEFLYAKNPRCLNQSDKFGRTPLHTACKYAAPLKVVRWLLEKNPTNVLCKDGKGYTPLHHVVAKKKSSLKRVKLLVETEPNVVKKFNKGHDLPVDTAILKGADPEIVKFLQKVTPENLDPWDESPHPTERKVPNPTTKRKTTHGSLTGRSARNKAANNSKVRRTKLVRSPSQKKVAPDTGTEDKDSPAKDSKLKSRTPRPSERRKVNSSSHTRNVRSAKTKPDSPESPVKRMMSPRGAASPTKSPKKISKKHAVSKELPSSPSLEEKAPESPKKSPEKPEEQHKSLWGRVVGQLKHKQKEKNGVEALS